MTQKTLGYVELEWTCPKCGTRNPGSLKTCGSCGAPQPQSVQFEQANQQSLISDEQKLDEAKKGADIHCPFCGTRNPADAAVCSQCGGDLKSGERRVSGTVMGAFKTSEAGEQVICSNCQTPNPAGARKCASCGASLSAMPSPAPLPAAPANLRLNKLLIILGSIGGLALIVACLFLVFSMTRKKDVTGQVQSLGWERVIAVEELRDVSHSGWRDEVPSQASLGTCEPRYRYTQAEAAPQATEVCGTPYTKDTGSGYGQVVQDCEYQVYADYCEYSLQEWTVVNQLQSNGADSLPAWPQLSLVSGQREGERTETYQVVFSTNEGSRTFTTGDAALFSQFQPGSQWTLVVNALGQIVSVDPK